MKKYKRRKFIASCIFIILIGIAFTFLIIDLLDPIKEAIALKNTDPINAKFEEYGFWAPLIIGLTQALQITITIFPAQPIQIIAGVTLGPYLGFLAAISGIFVGNFIIYILVRKIGSKFLSIFREKDINKLEELKPTTTSKRKLLTLAILYFVPIIPYGVIAFMAANTKMRFSRYMILTTLGTVPSLIGCLWLGNLINDERYKLVLIVLITIIVLSLIFARFHKQILHFISNPKYNMEYFQTKMRKPRPLLYGFFVMILKLYFYPRVNIKVKNNYLRKTKKPYIVIFNHPSKLDFIYAYVPLYPAKVNSVTAYYYFCNHRLGQLLNNLGAFPKFLFQPDVSSMKNIFRVIKDQRILGLSPEGRLSAYGCLEAITASTGKLLKSLNVPVILAKIDGAYLSYPKWATNIRRGRVEITYQEVFSVDDLKRYTVEEIDTKLYSALDYDDFKWQEQNRVFYKGKKFAEGLEHILYICPVCHHEFTYTSSNDTIHCQHCDTKVKLNHYYDFESDNKLIPKNIRDWYLFQKDVEQMKIEDPNYILESNVKVKLPDPLGNGFVFVGEGKTTLTHKGIRFVGTINNEEKDYEFKIQNLPAIPFGVKEDFEVYHHNTLYYFIPENIRECVKWSVVGELIYKKYMKDNNLS